MLPFALTACRSTDGPPLDGADGAFIQQAATAGASMMALGRVAVRRSTSPAVRQFAQRVVAEHAMIERELTTIARRRGVPLLEAPEEAKPGTWRELVPDTGAAFDRRYLAQQVQAQELQRALFRKQVYEGTDADLRTFATRYLPIVEAHGRMARALLDSVADPVR
jgi:putative membrane protein